MGQDTRYAANTRHDGVAPNHVRVPFFAARVAARARPGAVAAVVRDVTQLLVHEAPRLLGGLAAKRQEARLEEDGGGADTLQRDAVVAPRRRDGVRLAVGRQPAVVRTRSN